MERNLFFGNFFRFAIIIRENDSRRNERTREKSSTNLNSFAWKENNELVRLIT